MSASPPGPPFTPSSDILQKDTLTPTAIVSVSSVATISKINLFRQRRLEGGVIGGQAH
jgi:hypothetical protein